MLSDSLGNLIAGKNEVARVQIARRAGKFLAIEDLPKAERKAAEDLARELMNDAVENVRRELSESAKHSKTLPKDVAFKIAHDVDAIACPFLEVTEVFSESDWQQLILTISHGARIAVARRTSMSEGLALALAETGDALVAEALVENEAVPMSALVCRMLIEKFQNQASFLDKLAQRDGLHTAIVVSLIEKVSNKVRNALVETHKLPDYQGLIIVEAEIVALLDLMEDLPEPRLRPWALRLKKEGRLTDFFLLTAVRHSALAFFETGLSVLSGERIERARTVVRHEGEEALTRLMEDAGIPTSMQDDIWIAIQEGRSRSQDAELDSAAKTD